MRLHINSYVEQLLEHVIHPLNENHHNIDIPIFYRIISLDRTQPVDKMVTQMVFLSKQSKYGLQEWLDKNLDLK